MPKTFRRLGGGYTKIMFSNTESGWILVSGNTKFGAFLVSGNTKYGAFLVSGNTKRSGGGNETPAVSRAV
jgi:hypothetical protein